jgi:uncharacterized protein
MKHENLTSFIRHSVRALVASLTLSLAHADESFAEIKKAAEGGSSEAQNKLGLAYLWGKDVPTDANEAFKWFQKSADQSNANSQFWVGSMQTSGLGTRKNPEEGLKWILKSANQDNGDAQLFLGMKFMGGEEIFEHHKEAFEWLTKAAAHKIPMAYFYLGSYYLSGITGDHNITEAVKWLKMAADECQPNAQFTLGMLYISGKEGKKNLGLPGGVGVEQDLELGCMYLNLARASGDLNADSEAAWLKLEELAKTVPPEQLKTASIKAGNWAKNTADRGNPIAQYEVGIMYLRGFCFPKDLARAYLYGTLALEHDETRGLATWLISDVKKEISPAQLEESQRLLNEWKTAHPNK